MLKKLYSNILNLFNHNSKFFVKAYIDVSQYKKDIYVYQLQNKKIKLLLYNFITFTKIQKNYHIYKKKLYVIIYFTAKHRYMFNTKNVFTIYIDHKLLIKFLNAIKHENIYTQ